MDSFETAIRAMKVAMVIALVVYAAALSTPPGRLPLALRGLKKILQRDAATPSAPIPAPATGADNPGISAKRKVLAFFIVVLALVIAATL
ncbi:MAG: hypothetical protein J6P13_03330 [Kiritimatiellae bacterium]|nr:hypothetical protein [Kiritimatiellia bacterium]